MKIGRFHASEADVRADITSALASFQRDKSMLKKVAAADGEFMNTRDVIKSIFDSLENPRNLEYIGILETYFVKEIIEIKDQIIKKNIIENRIFDRFCSNVDVIIHRSNEA